MVRFSDMLGGTGDADEPSAPRSDRDLVTDADADADEQPDVDAPPATGTVQFVDQVGAPAPAAPSPPVVERPAPEPAAQSPQDVLDRLTQYASSARASERAPAPDAPVVDPVPPQPPVVAPHEPEAVAHEPEAASPSRSADADEPASDDLLPRAKRTLRKPGRVDKRRP
jgi:hypothetical protein